MRSLSLFISICFFGALSLHSQHKTPFAFHSGLNMRDSSYSGSNILEALPYGSRLTIVKRSYQMLSLKDFGGYEISDHWYEVEFNGKGGFVFGGYLSRFPGLQAGVTYYSIDSYIRKTFSPIHKSTYRVTDEIDTAPSCFYTEFYKEGITVTANSCHTYVGSVSIHLQDTRMSEVLSIMIKIFEEEGLVYVFQKDSNQEEIRIEQDICYYSIRETGSGGVLVFMECG